ncbi:MAG: AAA family ATPase [Pseudobdellovibrionaceae bacterium]
MAAKQKFAFPELDIATQIAKERLDPVLTIEHLYLALATLPAYQKIFADFGYNKDTFDQILEENLLRKVEASRSKGKRLTKEPLLRDIIGDMEDADSFTTDDNRALILIGYLYKFHPQLMYALMNVEDDDPSLEEFMSDWQDITGEILPSWNTHWDEDSFQFVSARARDFAIELRSREITEHHYWLAFLENDALAPLFAHSDMPRETFATLIAEAASKDSLSVSAYKGKAGKPGYEPATSTETGNIIAKAVTKNNGDHEKVTVYDLVSRFYRPDDGAEDSIGHLLKTHGITPDVVAAFLLSSADPIEEAVADEEEPRARVSMVKMSSNLPAIIQTPDAEQGGRSPEHEQVMLREQARSWTKKKLGSLGRNLVFEALTSEQDPVLGREKEQDRLLQILTLSETPNPFIFGDRNVGKTSLAASIAARIARGDVPASLKGQMVFLLEPAKVFADIRLRAEIEKRVAEMVEEAQQGKAILLLDNIEDFMGTWDVLDILKPSIRSGDITCIATGPRTTYQRMKARMPDLMDRFVGVETLDVDPEVARKLLHERTAAAFAKHHGVDFDEAAIDRAIKLSQLYIHDLPIIPASMRLLDQAGASVQCAAIGKPKALRQVEQEDVDNALTLMRPGKIPVVGDEFAKVVLSLPDELPKHVYGQDKALTAICHSLFRVAAGLSNPEQPLGSFLFSGPSGVGKKEVARSLADILGRPLLRFDMSEYMERHTVARLIGAPPGYVGYDKGGMLTDAVDQNPYCVLLLDEIEKAHQDVPRILLQILDHGKLTGGDGKTVDFSNVILIMTTNEGNAQVMKPHMGFGEKTMDASHEYQSAAKKMLLPELVGRLDEDNIIPFSHLSPAVIPNIVDKFLRHLAKRAERDGRTLNFSDAARAQIAGQGVSSDYGARKTEGYIKRQITNPLSEQILRKSLGQQVLVDFQNGAFVFEDAPLPANDIIVVDSQGQAAKPA